MTNTPAEMIVEAIETEQPVERKYVNVNGDERELSLTPQDAKEVLQHELLLSEAALMQSYATRVNDE